MSGSIVPVESGYLGLSLSNTLGWLVAVPEEGEEPVVPAVVPRERPRMKYQIRPAIIAKPMMIQSQDAPLPSSTGAGAGGELGAAGGAACASASFTAASVTIVKAWSLLSIMFPFRPNGLRMPQARVPLT